MLWLLVIVVFWGAIPYAAFDTERECQTALTEFEGFEAQQEADDWAVQCCRPSQDECPFSEAQASGTERR